MAIYCNPKINLLENEYNINEYIEEFENSFKIIMEECNVNDMILETPYYEVFESLGKKIDIIINRAIVWFRQFIQKIQMWIARTISKISQIDKTITIYVNKNKNEILDGYNLIKNGKVDSDKKFFTYKNFNPENIEKNFDRSNFDIFYNKIDEVMNINLLKNKEYDKIKNIKLGDITNIITLYENAFLTSILNPANNYWSNIENQIKDILDNIYEGKELDERDFTDLQYDSYTLADDLNYSGDSDPNEHRTTKFYRGEYTSISNFDESIINKSINFFMHQNSASKIYKMINKSIKDNYNRSIKYVNRLKEIVKSNNIIVTDDMAEEGDNFSIDVINILSRVFQNIYKSQVHTAKVVIFILNAYKFDMNKMFKYLVTVSQNYNNSNKNESTIFDNVQLV